MQPIWITIVVCIAITFIVLGTGANTAFATKNRSSALALKFGLFMALSHFFFYYIGAWITGFIFEGLAGFKWNLISLLLLTLAVKTAWNVFSYKPEDNHYDISKNSIQMFLALAVGLNALLCGIALTLSGSPHLNTALILALGAFVGGMGGSGLHPEIAKILLKLKPALVGAALFLALAIYYFIKF